jgi:glutamine---fructose-6-phosphate transaminase (isomerizing)
MSTPSAMRREAFEAPAAVAGQLAADGPAWAALGAGLHAQPPAALLTIARGSSDHAAHFMGYLLAARLGRLAASLPMSVVTLYGAQLVSEGLLAIAFSQSGQSPDLVQPLQHIAQRGGRTLAFVNDPASPLAAAAQQTFALHAGTETSVAATKSFIAQLVAGARLVAAWQSAGGTGEHGRAAAAPGTAANSTLDTEAFAHALHALPQALQAALDPARLLAWETAMASLAAVDRLYVLARGTALPVAMEAALKFKEVCGVQAEAYSGAEVQHGPMALIEPGFALLVLAPRGPAQAGLLALARQMRQRGARVLLAAPAATPGAAEVADVLLPLAEAGHADLDPLPLIQSFYPAVEALARLRGLDPDQPRHLAKVTRTR